MQTEPQTLPKVSVIVACRDEAKYIGECLEGLVKGQDYPGETEFIVADGRSRDATRSEIEKWCARDARVRLIDNPESIVPTGLNRAIAAATGEVVVRADAHTDYASDYVSECVRTLVKTGASCVGGPTRTRSRGYIQSAACVATHSVIALGGAKSKRLAYEGPADSVTYGCWRRKTLLDVGMYDERLVRNQDDELSLRITRAGGQIWQNPRIRSWVYPRDTLPRLFRQYWQYGYWKVPVILKHGGVPASPRHLVPGAFVAMVVLLAAGAPFSSAMRIAFSAVAIAYIACLLIAGTASAVAQRAPRVIPVLPAVIATMHFSYGSGFLAGIFDFLVRRSNGRPSATRISR